MDSEKPSPKRSKLLRTVAKVLHLRAIAPVDGVQKVTPQEKVKDDKHFSGKFPKWSEDLSDWIHKDDPDDDDDDEFQKGRLLVLKSLLAKLFANISSIKAAYAQLQLAQSPYDPDGIEAADQLVVSELKKLSELKQRYVRKQFDFSSSLESCILSAEVQELNSLSKTYEVVGKRMESQFRLKDSEIIYLKEKLEEAQRHNQLLEKRFNLYHHHHHQSGSSYSHFNAFVGHAVKSIRGFVKLMIDRMKSANWDLDAAAASIEPDVHYWRTDDDKCFAFESFVCRVMFDGFHLPNFSLPDDEPLLNKRNHHDHKLMKLLFFKRFTELKSVKAKEWLSQNPNSGFAKFCLVRYLKLIHPKMESSWFGNLSQRRLLDSGEFPETRFFNSFAEMARQIWLLHCLAFSLDPEASIFQVSRGCRFSQVYMESVAQDEPLSFGNSPGADTSVAFTVVPGFRIGKTVIQCQVYLSPKSKAKTAVIFNPTGMCHSSIAVGPTTTGR